MQGIVVDDLLSESVASGAEPHVCIGRLLAQRYDHLVREPLPFPMIALLVQIEYRELRGSGPGAQDEGH
jgi:hypothetical protein